MSPIPAQHAKSPDRLATLKSFLIPDIDVSLQDRLEGSRTPHVGMINQTELTYFSYPSNAVFGVVSWVVILTFGVPLTYAFVLYEKHGHDLQRTVMNQIHSFGLRLILATMVFLFTPRAFLPLLGPYSESTCSLLACGSIFFNVQGGIIVFSYGFIKYLFTCYYKRVGVLDEDFVGAFVLVYSFTMAAFASVIAYLSNGTHDAWFAICAQKSLQELDALPKVFRGPIRFELYHTLLLDIALGIFFHKISQAQKAIGQVHTHVEIGKPPPLPPKRVSPAVVQFGKFLVNIGVTLLSGGPAVYIMMINQFPPFTLVFSYFVTFSLVMPEFVMLILIPVSVLATEERTRFTMKRKAWEMLNLRDTGY